MGEKGTFMKKGGTGTHYGESRAGEIEYPGRVRGLKTEDLRGRQGRRERRPSMTQVEQGRQRILEEGRTKGTWDPPWRGQGRRDREIFIKRTRGQGIVYVGGRA